jgi:hypothetical protein
VGTHQVTDQQIPKIGEDVTALMQQQPTKPAPSATVAVPKVGEDVTHLMAPPQAAPERVDSTFGGLHILGDDPNAPTFRTEVRASDGLAGGWREMWERINPKAYIAGMYQTVADPVGTAKALISANPEFLEEAEAAAAKGDYATAFRKLLAYGSMGLGHDLDEQATHFAEGRWPEGLGGMAGTAINLMAPGAIARRARRPTNVGFRNTNAAEREAVAFGEREGIPIDAGTATGSQFVKRAQQMSSANLGGARRAEQFQAAQGTALERTMQKLTGEAHVSPITAEQAGTSLVSSIEGRITQQARAADDAYARLRALEDAAPPTTVQQPVTGRVAGGGTVKASEPVQMRMAVDLRPTKAAMRPIYDDLRATNETTPFNAESGQGQALNALRRLMEAPDYAPLSVADRALGEIKATARGGRLPALRTQGQGVAAQTVKNLEAAVMDAATKGGPEVVKALTEGRSATIAKHATADVLKRLETGTGREPVRVAGKLTAPNDSALVLLREVAKVSPQEIPKVGRAVLEGLLERQTAEGVFAKRADALWRDWQKLGPQTKAMLYPSVELRKALDNFFLLAKRIGDNPNPSGTALTRSATQWLQMAPNWAIAKLLYSPRGVRLLTKGFTIPATNRAGQAAWAAELSKIAEAEGVSLTPAGAVAADGQEREE